MNARELRMANLNFKGREQVAIFVLKTNLYCWKEKSAKAVGIPPGEINRRRKKFAKLFENKQAKDKKVGSV